LGVIRRSVFIQSAQIGIVDMVVLRQTAPQTLIVWMALAGCTHTGAANAQTFGDRLLSTASVVEANGCSIVKIEFNSRVQYLSHFPVGAGDELRVQINPLDKASGDRKLAGTPELLRAPTNERASIHGVELQSTGATTAVTLYFKRNVAFKVAQGLDFKSILVAIPGPTTSPTCLPVWAGGAAEESASGPNGLRGSLVAAQKAKSSAEVTPTVTKDQLEPWMTEARQALDKPTPDKAGADRAVQLLTKVIAFGDSSYRQDAQELLGTARERRGQMAHARAEYQEYLKLFPTGAGADRVKLRLAAIEGAPTTTTGEPVAKVAGLPVAASPSDAGKSDSNVRLGDDKGGRIGAGGGSAGGQDGTRLPQVVKSPADWTVSQYGSLSSFYNLNQGGRGFIETPRLNVGWDREDPYRTYQSAFLNNFDYDARFENVAFAGRFKFSASHQYDVLRDSAQEFRISGLFFDGKIKDAGVGMRVGRQTGYSGGVLGRFDGGALTYQAAPAVKVTAVAGSPVERSVDNPFANNRYFYGAGAEIELFQKSLDLSGYVIEQRAEGLVDRQSVGVEARFVKNGMAAFGGVDYDTHFGQLNSAVATGNKTNDDQSTISVNVDYRRSPVLLASNALQGQGVLTLSELLQRYTPVEIDRLAFDRTAQSYTGTASYSRPISKSLQWSSDVTLNYLSGMPASGGVDATRSTGMDSYFSTQLIATDQFVAGDSVTGGLRYANSVASDRYLLDFGVSYPINPDLRVHPMARFGYVQYSSDNRSEYQFLPSVRTSYGVLKDTTIEFEVGGKFILSNTDAGREYQNELLVLAGIRYDFSRLSPAN
jgi:hypothetical protein